MLKCKIDTVANLFAKTREGESTFEQVLDSLYHVLQETA